MYYKESDSQLIPPPVNFRTPYGSWIMNFNKSPAAMATYGWRNWTDEEVEEWNKQHPQPEPPKPDTTDFDNACKQFRDICTLIGEAIGKPDFKGGFDEMTQFAQSPAYGTIEGLQLAMSWSAANELCKYLGSKLELGQPEWWYACWQQESDSK